MMDQYITRYDFISHKYARQQPAVFPASKLVAARPGVADTVSTEMGLRIYFSFYFAHCRTLSGNQLTTIATNETAINTFSMYGSQL